MNYDEITKITAERISDYMTEAVNTDSIAVAEMFHNAAWGVRTLWFELTTFPSNSWTANAKLVCSSLEYVTFS